jgi:threonine synthase
MIHILAKMEGISVEPAAAVAFAGVIKLVRSGTIKPKDLVVINCTGHTMPIETEVLGDDWARNVAVPASAPVTAVAQPVPVEGLLSALNRVTADRFSRVAIVDDHPDARRLIRRILQSQGNFELMEAANGREAIELAQKKAPDLIILDLMMPEFDGFAVLDALKASSKTAHIPVIVVTAKELTGEEKERLHGQVFSLLQKGEFMNDEFMDEVRSLLH